jgi:hypothetical protein
MQMITHFLIQFEQTFKLHSSLEQFSKLSLLKDTTGIT